MPTQDEKDAARKRLLNLVGELVKIPTLGHCVLIDVKPRAANAPSGSKAPQSFPLSGNKFYDHKTWFWVQVMGRDGIFWYFLPAKSIQKVKSGPGRNPPSVPDSDDLD